MAEPIGNTRGMPLGEFIRLFEDPDPWNVSYQTWDSRVNAHGVPDRWYLLTDPDLREMLLDDLIAVIGPPPEKEPAEEPAAGTVDDLTARVGRELRFRRLTGGYSIRQVSRYTKLHPSKICRLERGRRDITLGELVLLTDYLGFPIEQLIRRARMKPEES